MPEARVEPYIFVQNNELKKGSRQKPYVPFNAVFGSKKLSGSYLILVQDKVKPNAVRRRFMVAVERNDKKDWLLKNLLISIGKGQFLLDSTLDGQNSVALFGGNFTYGGGVWTSKQGFSENKYFSQSHNSQLFRKAAQEYMLADSDGWERLTQDLDLIRGLNQDTGFATRYNRGGLVQVINRDPRFSVNGNKVNYVNGYSSGKSLAIAEIKRNGGHPSFPIKIQRYSDPEDGEVDTAHKGFVALSHLVHPRIQG